MNPKRAVISVRVSTSNRTSNGEEFEQNPEVQLVATWQAYA